MPYSLVWQATGGSPSASGILQLDVAPGAQSGFVNLPMSATDYSGGIFSLRVFVAAGTDVGLKLYMQSGSTFAWADAGQVQPTPGQWRCLSFDTANPAVAGGSFDTTEVVEIGVEVTGSGDITLLIDDARL